MRYKKNEAPDSEKVALTMTMGQVRFLNRMVGMALHDIEEFGEDEFNKAKPLQKLTDLFSAIVDIEMTEAEQLDHTQAWVKSYTKAEYERVHGVKL
ncbi:hypothetical protein [Methylotenera sp.]|uniref:hypothetical protein n=1 Tax=Methylotenera sp. TaxID=2051956 RepID=UPI0024870D56|nr:hypothetical protein [Methylotenera sp.]MDI1300274.1 hypothetical protein [Methylotenera sp.]